MAANTQPIYTLLADIQWGSAILSAANVAKNGTGTVTQVFSADAVNGGFIQKVRYRAIGTNVATVARLFINNGASNATAANNILYEEVTLPATTLSETSQILNQEILLGFALPPGYRLSQLLELV